MDLQTVDLDRHVDDLAEIESMLEAKAAAQRGEPLDIAAIGALLARWGGDAAEMEAMLARHRSNPVIERASAELQVNLRDSITLGLDPAPAWDLFNARIGALGLEVAVDDLRHVPPHPFMRGARSMAGGGGSGSTPSVVNPCPHCGVGMTSAGCGCQSGFAPGGVVHPSSACGMCGKPIGGGCGCYFRAQLSSPGILTAACFASTTFSGDFAEADDATHGPETLAVGDIEHTPVLAVMAVTDWLSQAAEKGWSLATDVVGDDGPVDVDRALQDLVNAIERYRCFGPGSR